MAVYADTKTYVEKKEELDKVEDPKALLFQLFEEMSQGKLGQIDPFYNPRWDAYRHRADEMFHMGKKV